MNDNAALENNRETINSYEAILLTAKGFGIETVTIKNPPIQILGPFDLSKEMKVPIGANLTKFNKVIEKRLTIIRLIFLL